MADYQRFFIGAAPRSILMDVALLPLRAFAGIALAVGHGINKLPPSDGFVEGVATMGFPLPGFFAWACALTETVGAGLLVIGLLTRPAAFFVAINMFVVTFIRHWDDPFRQKELPAMFFLTAILFLIVGAGRFSADHFLRRIFR